MCVFGHRNIFQSEEDKQQPGEHSAKLGFVCMSYMLHTKSVYATIQVAYLKGVDAHALAFVTGRCSKPSCVCELTVVPLKTS